MMLRQITPQLYIGTASDFGDAKQLETAGVELAILCHGWTGFPHSAQVGALAVGISPENPDWMVRGLAHLLADIYGVKVLAVCDGNGGLNHASYLIACVYAHKQGTSFAAGLSWLQSIIVDAQPDEDLIARGENIWP